MSDLDEKFRSDEFILDEVYGDDLDQPIDNDRRFINWRSYVSKPIGFEKVLGSTFEVESKEHFRLKRIQDQVVVPIEERRKNEYMERSVILKQYLNEHHLEEVYSLASEIKEYIKEEELIPTLLALYELKLFLEADRVLDDFVIREIFSDYYYSDRKKIFRKEKNQIRCFSIIFFHKLNRIVRDLYTEEGRVFSFKTNMIQRISESVKTFVNKYLFDKLNYNLLRGRSIPEDTFQKYKNVRTPRLFTKIMLSIHIKQQFQEIALLLNNCQLQSAKVNVKNLQVLSDSFLEKYLYSDKWIKTSYGIGLSLLKGYDPVLVENIIERKNIENFYPTFYNIKLRHGEFLDELLLNISEVIESPELEESRGTTLTEQEILITTQKGESQRKIETIIPEVINKGDIHASLINHELELYHDLLEDPLLILDHEKKYTNICKYLGIDQDDLITDRPHFTFLALHQLELLVRLNAKITEDSLYQLVITMETQYEFKRKRKKKHIWMEYLHRLNKIILSLYEDDKEIINQNNEYINRLKKIVQQIVRQHTLDYHQIRGDQCNDRCECRFYYRCMAAKTMFYLLF